MNPIDKIQSCYEQFTKTEKEIAIYCINHPNHIIRYSLNTLAEAAHTSPSAFVRFSKKIGYAGFAEFKFDMSRFLISNNAEAASNYTDSSIIAVGRSYMDHIQQLCNTIDEHEIYAIAKKIYQAKRIKILGFHRSYHSAIQLRMRLSKLNIDAEAAQDLLLMQDYTNYLNADDLCIIFTIADSGHHYHALCKSLHQRGCPIILITMSEGLPFKKLCQHICKLPCISKSTNISFLDDQSIFYVYIEILLTGLANYISTL